MNTLSIKVDRDERPTEQGVSKCTAAHSTEERRVAFDSILEPDSQLPFFGSYFPP